MAQEFEAAPAQPEVKESPAKTAAWLPVEGVVVAPALDPDKVCEVIGQAGVVAEVDWYEDTSHLLGLNVLVNSHEQVAVLDPQLQLVAGPKVTELVELLAAFFKADVSIGEKSADHVPAGAVFPKVTKPSQEVRVVEVTRMPMASVPFCAAVEGTDLIALELEDNFRAVMHTSNSDDITEGVMMTEAPGLALYSDNGDLRLAGVDKENAPVRHAAGLILHSWLMRTRTLYGSHQEVPPQVAAQVEHLFGDDDTAERLCQLVPSADLEGVGLALKQEGAQGIQTMVQALHLPAGVVSFLKGEISAQEVEGAVVHESRGWANAIGRSVDIMLTEPDSTGNQVWSTYRKIAVEKPWAVRVFASVEASVGATILTLAIRSKSTSPWRKISGVLGALMLFDSVAEVALAKYLGKREERYRKRMVGN